MLTVGANVVEVERRLAGGELAALRRLVDEGVSVTEAARTLKIGRSTAYAALSAH